MFYPLNAKFLALWRTYERFMARFVSHAAKNAEAIYKQSGKYAGCFITIFNEICHRIAFARENRS